MATPRLTDPDPILNAEIQTARKECDRHPDSPDAWQALGELQLLANDLAGARNSFSQLYSLRPDAITLFLRGRTELADEQLTAGRTYLEAARQLDPGSSDIAAGLGSALLRLGEIGPATTMLRFAVDVDPTNEEAVVALARIAASKGDFIHAIQLAAAVVVTATVDRLTPILIVADGLLAIGDFARSQEAYQVALSIAPDDTKIAAGLAQVQLLNGEDVAAEALLQRTLASDENAAEVHLVLGNLWQSRSDVVQAQASYEAAISANPALGPAYGALAALHLEQLDLVGARRVAEAGVTASATDASCRLILAQVEELDGNFARSEELAKNAAALNPRDHRAFMVLARAQIALSRPADAVYACLDSALSVAPDDETRNKIMRMKQAYADAIGNP